MKKFYNVPMDYIIKDKHASYNASPCQTIQNKLIFFLTFLVWKLTGHNFVKDVYFVTKEEGQKLSFKNMQLWFKKKNGL